ncbi:MAG: hypothetical protein P8P85_10405 [Acidimicrobiales bacterium]|nr:hypothetical protein [Acidimicrobiales bacterium]
MNGEGLPDVFPDQVGELRVTDFDEAGNEAGQRIRNVGDYSHTDDADIHMEQGGPDGAVVLFNLFAPDGLLTDALTSELAVIRTNTVDEVVTAWSRRR